MAKPIKVDYASIRTETLSVGKNFAGARLDSYIASRLPKYSRTLIQKLLKQEMIKVNGRKVKAGYQPKAGDEIVLQLPAIIEPQLVAADIPLEILYEDECMLAINKPPNMVVHPAGRYWEGTLANALLFYLSATGGKPPPVIDDKIFRPGIVHRLDKDTTGVILAAKTLEASRNLSEQFQKKVVVKEYRAIVEGEMRFSSQIIESTISRSKVQFRKMISEKIEKGLPRASGASRGGKHSTTKYEVIERFRGFTYVRALPLTGRTHQIRVHLASIGHPCIGDPLYARNPKFPKSSLSPELPAEPLMMRQALHAFRITFKHPITGQQMSIEAPLPADMSLVLDLFRKYRNLQN